MVIGHSKALVKNGVVALRRVRNASPEWDETSPRVRITSPGSIDEVCDMWMSRDVVDRIRTVIGSLPAEHGGCLGGDRATGVITEFVMDRDSIRSPSTYTPDVDFINGVLRDWNSRGVRFAGFVHSHPRGHVWPSHGDRIYAARLLDKIPDLERLALPIAQTARLGTEGSIHSYWAARRDGSPASIRRAELRIAEPTTVATQHFERVESVIDLEWMRSSRIVVVGAGGSVSFCRDLVRMGVGQVVLVDPDAIELSNVATQDVELADLDRPKAAALAERLVRISKHVRVLGVVGRVEELDHQALKTLVWGSLPGLPAGPPRQSLVCAFTDNFHAQAMVNRVALEFGTPMLAAQLYRGGSALELSFASPGISVACGRCVLGGRYRLYEHGFVNDVGSSGTPYSATAHLNAMKLDIALALIEGSPTHDPDDDVEVAGSHPARRAARDYLQAVGCRNLVQIRRDPDIATSLGLRVFERVLNGADMSRLYSGDVVWLPQEPENEATGFPACADCGGLGDLRLARNSFDDMSVMHWALADHRRKLLEANLEATRARRAPDTLEPVAGPIEQLDQNS